MYYLTTDELTRLLQAAYPNRHHHCALVTLFFNGLRVSELLAIEGQDVQDGQLSVERLKGSNKTVQPIHTDANPLFDGRFLIELAAVEGRLFPWSRQYMDVLIKRYGKEAGLHPKKCHAHAIRHAVAVHLWDKTKDLNAIVDTLGHKSPSSSLIYMRYDGSAKAQAAFSTMFAEA